MAPTVFPREAGGSGGGDSGLGLGWILFIALAGGVLLFGAIGLSLAWRLKAKKISVTTKVYPMAESRLPHVSTTRLSKRRLLASSYSGSRLSSRLSLSIPPVLPPLPSYQSYGFLGTRSGSRFKAWVDEDALHGPKMNKMARESWFSRDSWFGRAPTLPSLGGTTVRDMEQTPEPEVLPGSAKMQELDVPKRNSRIQLQGSQTAPSLATNQDEQYTRGRPRVPAQAHVRPSITDTDLRDILRCTDQRLRDGTSRSPTKTPRGSPSKGSPVKTPRSHRTTSSGGGGYRGTSGRNTPSPTKRGAAAQPGTPQTHSRNASISSIGSAANSLIAEATQQLEMSGGRGSPSRSRGSEWQQQSQEASRQQEQQVRVPARRLSRDSDNSSSLSTLYSVGDVEDGHGLGEKEDIDPFIEDGTPGPIPEKNTRRNTQGLSMISQLSSTHDWAGPTRPVSAISHTDIWRNSLKANASRLSIVLQPPSRPQSDDVGSKSSPTGTRNVSETPSMTSLVSESEDSMLEPELPPMRSEAEYSAQRVERSSSSTLNAETPEKKTSRNEDMSSSPYDEQQLLSLLLSSERPKRALPLPPTQTATGVLIPTPLSPPPKSKSPVARTRLVSSTSTSSSNYSDPFALVAPSSPPPVPVLNADPEPPKEQERETLAVGSTIAQLRRMNSIVSSYSVASLASTTAGASAVGGTGEDSPTLPTLRSENLSSRSKTSGTAGGQSISSRHYFNIGGSRKQIKRSGSQRSRLGLSQSGVIRLETPDEGKENLGLGLKSQSSRAESPVSAGLREGKGSHNRESRLQVDKSKLVPPREDAVLKARKRMSKSKRDSAESLGLYDKDGFLIGSPDREKGRLRM